MYILLKKIVKTLDYLCNMLYNINGKRVLRDFVLRTMSGRELSSIKQQSRCTVSNPLSFYMQIVWEEKRCTTRYIGNTDRKRSERL